MNLPTAVIAAMALCNEHVIATQGGGSLFYGGNSFITTNCSDGYITANGIVGCTKETDAQRKSREDAATKYKFDGAYAWEPPYQDKCKTIQDYVVKFQASLDKLESDKKTREATIAKAAEQPTLDNGIAALSAISR